MNRFVVLKIDEGGFKPGSMAMVTVQGVSAAVASGVSALITMPLDTVKTRCEFWKERGDRQFDRPQRSW